MHYFYIQPGNVKNDFIEISGAQARHAFLVLRLKEKDKIGFFDGNGRKYLGEIQFVSRDFGRVQIKKIIDEPKRELNLVLAQAIPKKYKFDDLVDKAVQLGVNTVIPMITERTIVKIKAEDAQAKRLRWQKIAVETAKQCRYSYCSVIEPITGFKNVLARAADFDLALIGVCAADNPYIKQILRQKKKLKNILVLIGPEGDFSEKEAASARQNGCVAVSLGRNVLRCDTAVNFILSVLNYEFGT